MISIFSNYLAPIIGVSEEQKSSEIYNQLRIAYNQGVKGILDNTRIISVGDEDLDYKITCEKFNNPAFLDWINWVNKKIVLSIGKEDYRTIDVRVRIAANMLDKIYTQKKFSTMLHGNLIYNVRREMSAINTEDLPF